MNRFLDGIGLEFSWDERCCVGSVGSVRSGEERTLGQSLYGCRESKVEDGS